MKAETIFSIKEKKNFIKSFIDFMVNSYLHKRSSKLIKEGRRQLFVYSFDHIGHKININGLYEGAELEFFFKWLSKSYPESYNGTALDIGANIGNHSLFFSDFFSKVKSYEPNKRTYLALNANSQLVENIETYNFGISDKECKLILHTNKNNVGGSFISNTHEKFENLLLQEIQLFKLDDIIDENEKIKLIKIDVEGHECKTLLGAKATIMKNSPLILFELNSTAFIDGSSPEIEILKDFGYNKFATIESYPNFFKNPNSRFRRVINFIFSSGKNIVINERIIPGNYYFIIAIPESYKAINY
jgi:FkbM family methyltransferase